MPNRKLKSSSRKVLYTSTEGPFDFPEDGIYNYKEHHIVFARTPEDDMPPLEPVDSSESCEDQANAAKVTPVEEQADK